LWLVLACLVAGAAGCFGPGSDWPKSDSAGGTTPAAGGTPNDDADDNPESSSKQDAGVLLDGAVRDAGLDAGSASCSDAGAAGHDASHPEAGVVVTADSGCLERVEPSPVRL
jgi:hypothetical protein